MQYLVVCLTLRFVCTSIPGSSSVLSLGKMASRPCPQPLTQPFCPSITHFFRPQGSLAVVQYCLSRWSIFFKKYASWTTIYAKENNFALASVGLQLASPASCVSISLTNMVLVLRHFMVSGYTKQCFEVKITSTWVALGLRIIPSCSC